MINDLSKILKTLKKGILIVEDGRPSYVVLDFKDYIDTIKLQEEFLSNLSLPLPKGIDKNQLSDDIDTDEINFLIENETKTTQREFPSLEEELTKNDDLRYEKQINSSKKDLEDLKEIKLSDLPF